MKLFKSILLMLVLSTSLIVVKADRGRLFTSDKLSSTNITCVVQDHHGMIWIGTQYGLNSFDGYRFKSYLHQDGDSTTIPHNNITSLLVDRSGTLWVGTQQGMAYFNKRNDNFVYQKIQGGPYPNPNIAQILQRRDGKIFIATSGFGLFQITKGDTLPLKIYRYSYRDENDYYMNILFDSKNRFWKGDNIGGLRCFVDNGANKAKVLLSTQTNFGVPRGIFETQYGEIIVVYAYGIIGYDSQIKQKYSYSTLPLAIEKAYLNHHNQLFIGTYRGLYQFDTNHQKLSPVEVENGQVEMASSRITSIFEDRQNNLWIGSAHKGILFVNEKQMPFSNWSLLTNGVKTGSVIQSAISSDNGGVLAAVRGGNLYGFNKAGRIISEIIAPAGLNVIYRDRRGQQWLSAGNNLYRISDSGAIILEKTFTGDFIQAIDDDGHGKLFVSTFAKGIATYDTRTGKVTQYTMYDRTNPHGFLCNDWVYRFHYDSKGLLWSGTSSGVSCFDPQRILFKPFGWHNILEGLSCSALAEDRQGNIFIGTDRGLYRFERQKNTVKPFPAERSELSTKMIGGIICEANGDLWCSTSAGIWHYQHANRRLVCHLSDNGLSEREYTEGVGLHTNDGRIVFANSEGLIAFHPNAISSEHKKPATLTLTNLLIGGKTINCQSLSDGKTITTETVSKSTHFTLSYLDNTFTMEFSNFDFANAANTVLEYKLNDDQWTANASGNNQIMFTHLQPGSYRLYVRAVDNGLYSATQSYIITIRAPWYRSWTAYFLYALLLISLAYYALRRYLRSRQQQLTEEKMQFLINATHDIRTPLTLILSPLHQLMRKKDYDHDTQEKLGLINHNANRILALVNQILDIRKIDKQQMLLQCRKTNLVPFLQNAVDNFSAHAKEHQIKLSYTHPDKIEAWIDRVQFDKVMQNLLSNAFKFTPDGGSIDVNVKQEDQHVVISVADTGPGLYEPDIPQLFNRFYQSAAGQAMGKEGTGIGLDLCKMIIEMHHGTLSARNRQDIDSGSLFTAVLHMGNAHLSSEQIKADNPESTPLAADKSSRPKTKYHVLLVDDDAEITDYISNELSDLYHFHSCLNGKEALHELLNQEKHYDLVVSDIMMPEMDGFTLLRIIKSNDQLLHLPVILLTSEAAVTNRLEGLQHGADAFLAKPFIVEELRIQIDNLLMKSQKLKSKFSGNDNELKEKVEQREVADNDKLLMDRIMQSVNKNLSDSDFSVEVLAAEAGLSRSQLHRKMKELTGISPSEFIRNLRLEQAARLLRERKVNVSQVAYSLGFTTLGNFSKAFKQHFGMSPTEYASLKNGDNE